MNLEKEKELFKRAYLNLRTADSTPFPDAVFDEYARLRDSEGYKLVPVESTKNMIISGNEYYSESCSLSGLYKAMIGACNEP